MKNLLQQVTLKNKLLIIIMSTVIFSLILVALVFIVSERYISKQSMSDKLIVVSRILADQSTAALSFNDQKVAEEVLSALEQEPSVILGCLYDSDKNLFARHAKLSSIACPKYSQSGNYQFINDYFEIYQPVILDKEIIGSVYLRATLDILNTWLLKFIILVLGVIILAGIAAYFLAQKQQEIISEPILNLAKFVRNISIEGNYSHRLPRGNDDEIGILYNAFNDLLEQIYHRQLARDKAEKTLSEREQFLSVTLNSIGDAVIVTDLEGNITRMNTVAEKLTGWTFKEAQTQLLKTVFQVVNIMDSEPIESPVGKVITTGEIIFLDSNACLIAKDGTERLIADSAAPIRNDKNEILGVILVFNDVTESKRQEEQLRRSQKMDALGKLTGGIAHDYNNLLSIILGYAEQLKEPLSDDPLFVKYLAAIEHAAERGTKLTKKLLAFTRQKSTDEILLNINDQLQEQKLMLEKTLTVRISVELDLAEDLWSVWLDSGDLEDAIINMSINASHAITGNGCLTFRTNNEYLDDADAFNLSLSAGEYVLLSISDTGSGMEKNILQKVFDPFFSTKGEHGTGLGLSQVYGFVKRSGGEIKVYSEKEKGTSFNIYFPRSGNTKTESSDLYEGSNESLGGNETLLIVDDEIDLLELAQSILLNKGYHVHIAGTGNHALTVLQKEKIDLMLSDVIMPNMDGYQLATMVKNQYPHIKIQMMSGFAGDRHEKKSVDGLHDNLLYKPYTSHSLLSKIRTLLDSD